MKKTQRSNKNILGDPNRGNYQIWIISALLAAIMGFTYFSKTNAAITITERRFEEMLLSNDVEKVILIKNKDIVEVTLKQEALQNSKYIELKDNRSSNGPHYKFKIVDAKIFNDNFNRIQEKIPEDRQINYEPEERQGLDDIFFNYGFIFLLLFGFWFLMKRMSGGGGPGGQIFNIGKSKAALFDAENNLKVTFKDAAGLEEAKEEIKEIVEFLQNPGKFTKLGGKIPKGALLVGPPGTGNSIG